MRTSAILGVALFARSASGLANAFTRTLRKMDLTVNQKAYLAALRDDDVSLVVCSGPAGTGKTAIALLHALGALKTDATRGVILTRPTVLVDDDEGMGALPGDLNHKMQPLTAHLDNIAAEAEDRLVSAAHALGRQKAVEVLPLQFIRGRTFKHCIVIGDEIQNATPKQLKALLTRSGDGCKMILNGDVTQCDLPGSNGLTDLLWRLREMRTRGDDRNDAVALIDFNEEDIRRSEFVKYVIRAYDV